MGKRVVNLSGGVDWATGEQQPFVELHMQLPIDQATYAAFNELIGASDFPGARDLLVEKFPHYEGLIREWVDRAEIRHFQETGSTVRPLVHLD